MHKIMKFKSNHRFETDLNKPQLATKKQSNYQFRDIYDDYVKWNQTQFSELTPSCKTLGSTRREAMIVKENQDGYTQVQKMDARILQFLQS